MREKQIRQTAYWSIAYSAYYATQ